MKLINALSATICAVCLLSTSLLASDKVGSTPSTKKTCCEKANAESKDCTHKCCLAAHKEGKSCVHCNPDKQDLKLKKGADKITGKSDKSAVQPAPKASVK